MTASTRLPHQEKGLLSKLLIYHVYNSVSTFGHESSSAGSLLRIPCPPFLRLLAASPIWNPTLLGAARCALLSSADRVRKWPRRERLQVSKHSCNSGHLKSISLHPEVGSEPRLQQRDFSLELRPINSTRMISTRPCTPHFGTRIR